MNFKIDTKEKFHVITLKDTVLTANMTEDLRKKLTEVTETHVKHIILNFKEVSGIDEKFAAFLGTLQAEAMEQQTSFVLCELQPTVKATLDQYDVLDILNWTPTESEAWDIVQMEEIERELLGGEDPA